MSDHKKSHTIWRVTLEGFIPAGTTKEELAAFVASSVNTSIALHHAMRFSNIEMVHESVEESTKRWKGAGQTSLGDIGNGKSKQ